ncbi:hypothetical protein [Dolichospermum sp. UHCC 0315A]|uniref:hypothetical protein n=1 Tax=Dolichospermum sp. UHCC 0315A TaxID=1914871 RepID=UPI001FF0609C|nr:hypothetical protein [Dolichospermum sp. UHCC 0315A]
MLVGAKHLEDKLSVIAKNSSPNASPVQLSVITYYLLPNFLYKLYPNLDYRFAKPSYTERVQRC